MVRLKQALTLYKSKPLPSESASEDPAMITIIITNGHPHKSKGIDR
jgi:hypothetical protein